MRQSYGGLLIQLARRPSLLAQQQQPDVRAASTSSPPAVTPIQLPSLEEKIARIRETANWRFVDKRFLETIEERQNALQGVAINVRGLTRDEQDQPVARAFVLLRLHNSSVIRKIDGEAKVVFAATWSDDKGVFKFDNQPTPWFEPGHPLAWELCVFAPGYAVETRQYQYMDGETRNERIQLQRERVIEGTVKDSDGNPITDIEFAHVEIVNPYNGADVGIEHSTFQTEVQYFIQPDRQGRFRIGGLPPKRIANLVVQAGTRLVLPPSPIHVATSADLEPEKMIANDHKPRSEWIYPTFRRSLPEFLRIFGRWCDGLHATPRSSRVSR